MHLEGIRVCRRAFTAVELTIVVGIVAVLSAIAMPTASKLLDRIRVRAAVTEIESLFGAARHIAIARATQASVEIDAAARVISVTLAADTVRRARVGAEHDVSLTSNRASMSYSATGLGYGAANLSIVVRKGSALDTIVVSRLGRVRH
jgi:prepilin-type N-terminal cleavage/methylation domain-containing protein